MSLLLETISIRSGRPELLHLHNARMNRSRRELFHCADEWDLAGCINVPPAMSNAKCRVVYSAAKIEEISFAAYSKRIIRSLRLVVADDLDYSHKYLNRRAIDSLMAQRGDCDDLLFVKNGLITDSTYCNVALLKGGQWFTPAAPLLPGVQREHLIGRGIIIPAHIAPADLPDYTHIRLFNAMMPWDDCIELGRGSILE